MASAIIGTAATKAALEGALKNTRQGNFAEWYREVLKKAGLAESSAVRGCMVIKPQGYGVWEQIQRQMDDIFKKNRLCENAYFPLFIPVGFFEKEATHVAGFAKECAVVTHYRMKVVDGKMVVDPDAKLGEPLVVRPTSETIIGDSMQKWVQSHKDLPLKLNQWCNVVRWENETRPFLRTTEFLWQEGHCAFASEKEARENARLMAGVYQAFMTQNCALPVILGEKSVGERFAGADQTFCLEAMMQDGRAVQAGTSHYLGQHFSKASDIQFTNANKQREHAYTTSWGVSTRLIGSLIMVHSDDFGLRMPPRISPKHVVIIPSGSDTPERNAYIAKVQSLFDNSMYEGRNVIVDVDSRDKNAGKKGWDWIRKGVPIRLEIGPKEAEAGTATLYRRDSADPQEKTVVSVDTIASHVVKTLTEIQTNYFNQADAFLKSHIRTDLKTRAEIEAFFKDPNNIGFVRAPWCGDLETEEALKEDYKVTIRCLPMDQMDAAKLAESKCILTGKPAKYEAIFGRSY